MNQRRLVKLVLLGLACLACTGGTFTCESGDKDDDDKIIVKGSNK
jgi:hypothetical protein